MKQLPVHRLRRAGASACVVAAALWGGAGLVMAKPPLTPLTVNPGASVLSFNTTKAGTAGVGGVTETMQFKRFEGGMDPQGRISLRIDLTSIDSGIGIRDERMQSMLWQVGQYPSVTFSGQIRPETLPVNTGETVALDVQGDLTMSGRSKPVTAQLQVTALQGKWLVGTRKPVLVLADDFGLTAGVEALRAIMGLNYLSTSVPVTFQLELRPMPGAGDKKTAVPVATSTVAPVAR